MTKKEDNDLIHRSTELHTLPCKLTKDEKAQAAKELAEKIDQLEALEETRKATMSEFKSKKENLQAQVLALGRQVREGTKLQSVECQLQLNYSKQRVRLIRLDTNEVIEERPMTDEEKQMNLEFDETV